MSKRRLTSAGASALLVSMGILFQTGCGSRVDTVEGETHWLSTCSEANPCGDGLSCECGVCTQTCKRDNDCNDLESDSVCSPGDDTRFARACTASQRTQAVCVTPNDLKVQSGPDSAVPTDTDSGTGNEPTSDAGTPPDGPAPSNTTPVPGGSNALPSPTLMQPVGAAPADKIDLLFVVDNSAGMAEKQRLLKQAVPNLISRLVNPRCVDAGGVVTNVENAEATCPAGATREFRPVADINVAVITTSLGDFGADDGVCTPDGTPAKSERNDSANLLGLLPRGVTALAGKQDVTSGFLHWGAGSDLEAFGEAAGDLVAAAGEYGCGYEATLESWYRFLVDPMPYTKIVRNDCGLGSSAARQCIGPEVDGNGFIVPDTNLLAQRQAFLRPDSVVGVVLLTDENDCSFRTSGQSWRLSQLTDPAISEDFTAQYKSSKSCETDPEDACCFSCGLPPANVPAGCDLEVEECVVDGVTQTYPGWGTNSVSEPPSPDHPNLRCFKQKSRFGVDYLFPVQRYVNALTQPIICPAAADLVATPSCQVVNPLFDDLSTTDPNAKKAPRPAASVFLAGIVGVPWQDLAVDPAATGLEYRKADGSGAAAINWQWLLGDKPFALAPKPGDILMHEQVEPRDPSLANPAPGGAVAPITAGRLANPVNGHDWDTSSDHATLQAACIFPKAEPVVCSTELPDDFTQQIKNCDCTAFGNDEDKNPLCQAPDGNYGLTQYFDQATPGLRELQVLHGMEANAVVSSICPKVTNDTADENYGYLPAVAAIVDHLKGRLAPAE